MSHSRISFSDTEAYIVVEDENGGDFFVISTTSDEGRVAKLEDIIPPANQDISAGEIGQSFSKIAAGGAAIWSMKDLYKIATEGKSKKGKAIAAILGSVSGYSFGYKYGYDSPSQQVLLEWLNNSENQKRLEHYIFAIVYKSKQDQIIETLVKHNDLSEKPLDDPGHSKSTLSITEHLRIIQKASNKSSNLSFKEFQILRDH